MTTGPARDLVLLALDRPNILLRSSSTITGDIPPDTDNIGYLPVFVVLAGYTNM